MIQIRAELGKILQEPDVTKATRERFQGGWRQKLLTVLRQSQNKDVMQIMEEAEGLDISDENGKFHNYVLLFELVDLCFLASGGQQLV